MSLESLPNRNYDLINQIERVNHDLDNFIKTYEIDDRWLSNIDHIGIQTSGLDDFKEKFVQLSQGAVNAYKGEVYHQHLAAIELSEGFEVHPNADNAKWIELIGPRLREIPESQHFRSLPEYPDTGNIHLGFYNKFDERAYEYFFRKGVDPETSSTPRHSGFMINLNLLGDSIQIMDTPLYIIINKYMTDNYTDVDLKKIV